MDCLKGEENMDTKNIKFEEKYQDEEYDTTTFYFICPKEMLEREYTDAEHATISIECPTNQIEANVASVMISPTKKVYDNTMLDYDWRDIDLSYDQIEEFLNLIPEENLI